MLSGIARQGVAPKTVIDVGANVGQFAVAAAKLFPGVVVHSFEAAPAVIPALQRHVAQLTNVTVHPYAVGDHEGETQFHVNTHSQSSSILPLAAAHGEAFSDAREAHTVLVRLTTLDAVLSTEELRPPVLLKLDVQGYEAAVLRGASKTLTFVQFAVIETSFKPMYEGETLFVDLLQLMDDLEFDFRRPVGWLRHPGTGEIVQMDALFVQANQDEENGTGG